MHDHPLIRGVDLGSIGVWESGGEIVGAAHREHDMGTVYLQVDPEYDGLKEEMLNHAKKHISVKGNSTSARNNRRRAYEFYY